MTPTYVETTQTVRIREQAIKDLQRKVESRLKHISSLENQIALLNAEISSHKQAISAFYATTFPPSAARC